MLPIQTALNYHASVDEPILFNTHRPTAKHVGYQTIFVILVP